MTTAAVTTTSPRYTVAFIVRQGWAVHVDGQASPSRRFVTKREATACIRNIRAGLTSAASL